MNDKAIVTLAIGKRYYDAWKESCETHWGTYAKRHGYDLVCIDQPLDTSERARNRSPAWQKCLILSQDFSSRYRRIVWIDADILINNALAPDVCDGVPLDKVGGVEETSRPTPELHMGALRRLQELHGWKGVPMTERGPGRQYYRDMGLPPDFDQVVEAAVLVFSPVHHRALLEKIYNEYENKGGREWHMEMPALSYELLKAGAVHWLDPRFNTLWIYEQILHYPFLATLDRAPGTMNRVKRKLERLGVLDVRRACMTASFCLSFFLHIGGGDTFELMNLVDTTTESWRKSVL